MEMKVASATSSIQRKSCWRRALRWWRRQPDMWWTWSSGSRRFGERGNARSADAADQADEHVLSLDRGMMTPNEAALELPGYVSTAVEESYEDPDGVP